MARRQANSITSTITGTFDRVIRDYPLLVLHSAFILGVLLGQQTARTRFSLMDWARDALPEAPRSMTAALPSFTRRSSAGRKAGRRKSTRRASAGQSGRATGRSRRQAGAAVAVE
jgi:hypothetical protein